MITVFKLSRIGVPGFRRVAFDDERPTWDALQAKIEALYSISSQNIAVSYVDADGDKITLNSSVELADMLTQSPKEGAIRLDVVDLSAQESESDGTDVPRNQRDTFGGYDEEWQRIPGLDHIYQPPVPPSEGPHAFVEVIASDLSRAEDDGSEISFPPPLNKGKGRAEEDDAHSAHNSFSDDISSNGSLYGDHKQPIHVMGKRASPSVATFSNGSTVVPRHTATRDTVDPVSINSAEDTPVAATAQPTVTTGDESDPPLATFADEGPTSASLSNDIANLLSTFGRTIEAHPELAEGLRAIIRNATSGAYWSEHRAAVAQAAEDIRRNVDEMQSNVQDRSVDARLAAEQEAGRRVAQALGGILRNFNGNLDAVADSAAVAPEQGFPRPQSVGLSRPNSSFDPSHMPRGGPPPPPPPPGFGHGPHHRGPQPFNRGPWSSGYLPPPPRPWNYYDPMGPPGPSHGYGPVGSWGRRPYSGIHPGWGEQSASPAPIVERAAPAAQDTTAAPVEAERKPSGAELRQQVEIAKAAYRQEKEKYRKEREERRKEKELREKEHAEKEVGEKKERDATEATKEATEKKTHAPPQATELTGLGQATGNNVKQSDSQVQSTPPRQLVSNARGRYPELEMVSVGRRASLQKQHIVPSRSQTQRNSLPSDVLSALGAGPNTTPAVPNQRTSHNLNLSPEYRATSRITRSLHDMGFTTQAYPSIPSKIKSLLPTQMESSLGKEGEDNLITTVIEQLLESNPPVASGSRDSGVPTAWNVRT